MDFHLAWAIDSEQSSSWNQSRFDEGLFEGLSCDQHMFC